MFRDVPGCSRMFHVPGFIDGRHNLDTVSLRTAYKNQKKIYFTHNKENNICNIFHVLFQQLSANEHHKLHD